MKSNTPEFIVQKNLDAYNSRNIDAFMDDYHKDIKTYNLGKSVPTLEGLDAVRNYYGKLFENSPQLHSKILSRICIGNKVIDHERITGRNGSAEEVELVLIYEVEANKIKAITVLMNGE